jgi:hypothetical protein
MCYNYSDGEINNIFDKKKDYEQDETYFSWLDSVTQKQWNENVALSKSLGHKDL